jgi:hypothetical protein
MNMLPSLTLLQDGNDTGRDPVLTGYSSVSTGVAANGSDLILGEFRRGDVGSFGLPVSSDLIAGVVGVRTPSQVGGVKANRIVATVKRKMVGWFGFRLPFKNQRDNSCLGIDALEADHPVTIDTSVRPLPAFRAVAVGKAVLEKLKRYASVYKTRVEGITMTLPTGVVLNAPSPRFGWIRAVFNRADWVKVAVAFGHRFLLSGIGQGRAAPTVPAPLFYYGKGLI